MSGSIQESSPIRAAMLVKCLGLGGTERQFVELLRGLDRSRVAPRAACLMKVGELLPQVRALGIDPPEFPLRGTLARPNTATQVVRLAKWLSRERAAVLHCHDFYSNVLGSMAARLAGVPWIASRRDMGILTGVHQPLLATITRLAPLVLCNSRAIRDVLVDREGVDPARIRIVPNGLDLDRFDRERRRPPDPGLPGLDEHGPVVTLVANLKLGLKGHDDFLEAAAAVREVVPDVRFLLVGGGELRPQIEAQAARLGLQRAVLFAGYRTDVPALLARSTIAVSASTTEGLSNAIIEAMAAALPVVATAVGGTRELVIDRRTGFLVPAGRPDLLADRVVTLLRAPDLAARMGQAGRRHVEEELCARRLSERVTGIYEELSSQRVRLRRAA